MASRTDVSGEDGIRVLTVEIEPRPVVVNGEVQCDERTGELIVQRSATILVLPGEPVQTALSGTYRGAVLKGSTPAASVPAQEQEEETMKRAQVLQMLTQERANSTV